MERINSKPGVSIQPNDNRIQESTIEEKPSGILEVEDSFVSELVKGTFQAVVDSSVQQMEGYSDLIENTADAVDAFVSPDKDQGSESDSSSEASRKDP